ncbi:MAG: serine--tRNA ligase, partial [Proteiniphilum sp.]
MLTLKVIRENREEVVERLARKNFDGSALIDDIITQDDLRRSTQTSLDTLLNEVNNLSRSIGSLMKEGKKEEANEARARVNRLKESAKELGETLRAAEEKIESLLVTIPNLPHHSVPAGTHAEDNLVERSGG